VATNVTIGSTASIYANGDIEIAAETTNQIASSAFALIGEYKVGKEKINKDNALALSTPIIFMNNSTKVWVYS